MNGEILARVAFTLWHIWKERNKAIFRHDLLNVTEVLASLQRAIDEFCWCKSDQTSQGARKL